MAKRDIVIALKGDGSGLQKTLDDAESRLGTFGSKVGSVLGGVAKAGGLLAAGGIAAAVPVIADAIGKASDFNETLSKTNTIFGDSSAAIIAWADDAAQNMGQSRQQALDAAGSFATFGKAAGFGGDDLVDFSKNLTGLSSDLASFHNTSPEEAIEAIGAALRGESEPIRKFGVMLNEDTLKATALSKGLVQAEVDTKKLGTAQEAAEKAARKSAEVLKKYGENSVEYADAVRDQKQAEDALAEVMDGKVPQLTQAQKMQAAYLSILDQTAVAQGDFEKTSGGLANKQRILAAEFADAKQELGAAFLPLVLGLADVVLTKVIPAFREFARWIQHIADVFRAAGWQEAAKEVLGKVGEAITAVGAWIRDTGAPMLWEAVKELAGALARWVADPAWPWLLEHLGQWLSDFGSWLWNTAIPWLGEQALELAKKLSAWVADPALPWLLAHLGEWLKDFGKWFVTEAIPWVAGQAWELAKKLSDWVNDAAERLKENLPGWLGAFTQWMVTTAVPTAVVEMAKFAVKMHEWVITAATELVKALPGWLWAFGNWITFDALPAVFKFGVSMAERLRDGILDTLGFAADVASEIVSGLIQGMWDNAQRLKDALVGWVDSNIPGPIKKALSILSPSKVMAGIGGQIADGLVVGLTGGAGKVSAASEALAGAAKAAFPDLTAGKMVGGSAFLTGGQMATIGADPVSARATLHASGGAGGAPVIVNYSPTFNVYQQPGEDAQHLVDRLVAHQRRNGPLPFSVTGTVGR